MAAISKELREISQQPWFPIMMRELGYEPIKHGRWEQYLDEGLRWKCSKCGSRFATPWQNCPHCRARMSTDGKDGGENG